MTALTGTLTAASAAGRIFKAHGTGNDFVIVIDMDDEIELTAGIVAALCDRHKGIGADGVIRITAIVPGDVAATVATAVADAPVFMDYRNADGSIVEMCGNGVRVVAKVVHDQGLVPVSLDARLPIGTRAGLRPVRVMGAAGVDQPMTVTYVTVDMGPPVQEADAVGLVEGAYEGDVTGFRLALGGRPGGDTASDSVGQSKDESHGGDVGGESGRDAGGDAGGGSLGESGCNTGGHGAGVTGDLAAGSFAGMSMGNPHAVTIVDDVDAVPLGQFGPAVERHAAFTEGVNVNVVQVVDADTLRLRVWERGVGETQACGTGACATVAVMTVAGMVDGDHPVDVVVAGGMLRIDRDDRGHMLMTGSAEVVATITLDAGWLTARLDDPSA